MSAGEVDLVALARQGNRDAFGQLAIRHRIPVRRLLHRLLGPAELDDLEQDVFLAAWQGIRKFRGDAAFATWLTRIAIHRARRAMKRRRPAAEPLPDIAVHDPDPLIAADVRDAVAALPVKLRIVMALRCFEEMGAAEIARALGLRPGTVRSRLHAARQKLAEVL